jgi:DNA-binding CsgD family transcriptional regulator
VLGRLAGVKRVTRDDAQAALETRWSSARQRRGGLVLVTGEAGSGKSTLVEEFVATCDDARPLWGACDQLSTPRPLGPVHDLTPQLGDLTRSDSGEARLPHEVYAAVFDQLAAEPSVLVVEDLHWADQATIDLLRFLLRRIGTTRSLVIGTVRDDEIDAAHPLRALLGDAARSSSASTIVVPPLTVDEVATLVGDRPLDPTWLQRRTAGNAFFVVEMLDHHEGDLPSTVRDAILARTAPLDQRAWDVLHLLACAPESIADNLLAPLGIGIPELRALDGAGLIRRRARGVSFRHDLCRTAIAGTIPPGADVELHRRMLDALEAAPGADATVLVHHALGARDPVRILEHATSAAHAAIASGAHTQAAKLFRIALDQGALTTPERQAELLELLADEYYLIDQLDEAIRASERALAVRSSAQDARGVSLNHRLLSVYSWYDADRDNAERHADEAVAALTEVAGDPAGAAARGQAIAMQAYLALQANDLPRARSLSTLAAEVGGDHDPQLLLRTSIMEGICDVLDDEGSRRESMLQLLAPAGADLDEIYSSGFSNLTYLDVEQRRLPEANDLLGTSIPLTIERDLPICRVWQIGSRGRLKLLEGDWDEAIDDAGTVLSVPSAPLARTWPHLVRGLVALRRGGDPSDDLDEAWGLAQRLREPMRLLPVASAIVERTWLTSTDDPRLEECRDLLAGAPRTGLSWARGELASRLRRLDPGLSVEDVAEPYQLELAGQFELAAQRWDAIGAPYERALALADSGQPELVRAGLDILDDLGADVTAAWFRQDLRRRGMDSVPQRRRRSTAANAAGLTARQVDVLKLLGDGLTNAELAQQLFISPKTADHHVSAILTKLGVSSRREAVRAARDLDLVD